jgi:hypothetical protein
MTPDGELRVETPLTASRIGIAVILGAAVAAVVIALMMLIVQGAPGAADWVSFLPSMLTSLPLVTLGLLIVFGSPVIIYGAVLLRLDAATPLRITLPPGILYAVIAALLGVGTSPSPALVLVPAVAAGGMTAYWHLARRTRTDLSVESVF